MTREERRAYNAFTKKSKVLTRDVNGNITKIQRGRDGAIIEIGTDTRSGGKVLAITENENASGGMFAEIGKRGVFTAIPSIVLLSESLEDEDFDGTEGQDRENYTDDQDRENYSCE